MPRALEAFYMRAPPLHAWLRSRLKSPKPPTTSPTAARNAAPMVCCEAGSA